VLGVLFAPEWQMVRSVVEALTGLRKEANVIKRRRAKKLAL